MRASGEGTGSRKGTRAWTGVQLMTKALGHYALDNSHSLLVNESP